VRSAFDTNVLIYAQTAGAKGDRARALLAGGGVASVQALNEVAAVLRRKQGRGWDEIAAVLDDLRDALDAVTPLTVETHETGLELARSGAFSLWDGLIVAAALDAGCERLWSEDMQDGRRVGPLVIANPFAE
jgi:predicted nucleic acid-binding protein